MLNTITGLSSKETQKVLYLYLSVDNGIAQVFGHSPELIEQVIAHLKDCSECNALFIHGREQKRREPPDLQPSELADEIAKEFFEPLAIRKMAGDDHPWSIAESEEAKVFARKQGRTEEEAFLKHLKALSSIGD